MKKSYLTALICLLWVFGKAQNYIPYNSYVSASGPFGQPFLYTQFSDNILYSATSRFGVTSSAATPSDHLFDGSYDGQPFLINPGTSTVLTIDFLAKGGTSLEYAGGLITLNFYYYYVPESVSARIQRVDGNWETITGWTNVSKDNDCQVWQGQVPFFNYAKTLEITIVARSTIATSLNEVEYIQYRPGKFEPGIVTKFTNQTLYKGFYWRDTDALYTGSIESNGTAYFKTSLGLGTHQPTAQLHTTGTVRFAGITDNNSPTRILVGDADGKLYYRDAATLGTGSAWAFGGNSVNSSNSIGTTSNYDLPFITNNMERLRIGANGNVGIGTDKISDANYRLFVQGGVRARRVKVDVDTWYDHVFESNYKLPTIKEVEEYIAVHKHLPEVPSAAEVKKDGLNLGENQGVLLKKIEELTLYLIQQNKKLAEFEERELLLSEQLELLETKIKKSRRFRNNLKP